MQYVEKTLLRTIKVNESFIVRQRESAQNNQVIRNMNKMLQNKIDFYKWARTQKFSYSETRNKP